MNPGNPFVWTPPAALFEAAWALGEVRRVRRGEVPQALGDPPLGVSFILEGRFRIERLSAAGHPMLVTLLFPGSWFGDLNVLLDLPRSDAAIADTDGRVLFLAKARFWQLLEGRPALQLELLKAMTGRLRTAMVALEDSQTARLPQRIARRLVALAEAQGGDSLLPVTQQMVADMIGVTRENAARVLGMWRRAGLIETGRRRLRLVDIGRLSAL